MLITAYGMFWRRDEVVWRPGAGQGRKSTGTPFELAGRSGKNRGRVMLIDARKMSGVYLLHNDYGTHYVGLARGKHGLGSRLKAHTRDGHADKWNSFSWFAFDTILSTTDAHGFLRFNRRPDSRILSPVHLIQDVEAMLMLTLGTVERGNQKSMRFQNATKWHQVQLSEREMYLKRT